jgi:hypothetical protein
MNDVGTIPRHMLDVRELTAEAFAPLLPGHRAATDGRPGCRDPLRPRNLGE